jgi:glycosyltransferase involved in cell wall biosynthesis
MDNNPLFSVCIANYNNGKYLLETVESVIQQSYENWEIIIVDDGSTDNSNEIYKLCTDNRIKIFHNEKNFGTGYTFRRTIELSSGEVFGLLGAEDTLTPDALAIMIEQHIQHQNTSIIYSQYFDCDENLNVLGISTRNKAIESGSSYLLQGCNNEISSFATFKRTKYNETEGINPNQKRAVDTDLYLKMEEVGETLFIEQPLYYYRHNSNSISLNNNGHKAVMWHISAMLAACDRRNLPKEEFVSPYIYKFQEGFTNRINSLEHSREYKIGSKITRIERFIKNRLKKIGIK